MWYLAEGNLALILACTREMPRLRRHMLEQPTWVYHYASPLPTLRRKTMGFMGFGAVGRLLLGLLRAVRGQGHRLSIPTSRHCPKGSRAAGRSRSFSSSPMSSLSSAA